MSRPEPMPDVQSIVRSTVDGMTGARQGPTVLDQVVKVVTEATDDHLYDFMLDAINLNSAAQDADAYDRTVQKASQSFADRRAAVSVFERLCEANSAYYFVSALDLDDPTELARLDEMGGPGTSEDAKRKASQWEEQLAAFYEQGGQGMVDGLVWAIIVPAVMLAEGTWTMPEHLRP